VSDTKRAPTQKQLQELLDRAHEIGLRLFIAADVPLAKPANLRLFDTSPGPYNESSRRPARRRV
jgi:hypothetical protein